MGEEDETPPLMLAQGLGPKPAYTPVDVAIGLPRLYCSDSTTYSTGMAILQHGLAHECGMLIQVRLRPAIATDEVGAAGLRKGAT